MTIMPKQSIPKRLFISVQSLLLSTLLFLFLGCTDDTQKVVNFTTLVMQDEFDKNGAPDPNLWGFDIGRGQNGWGNNELQFYTNRSKNVTVKDGNLVITAEKESFSGAEYTSARLITKGKFEQTYGRFEARMKLPWGQGMWPAFWMLGADIDTKSWPLCGEIDIMEHVGYDPGIVHGTVHTEAFNHLQGTQKGGQLLVSNFATEFHTYAVDWKQGQMDFYIDGNHYFTFKNTGNGYQEWPFDQPFYLILNLAVGGNWGGKEGVDASIWPQRMEVDYVRVYKQNPQLHP